MVNAVGGGPKPAPVKKPEETKEEKKPESQAPAPSPAPAERPNAGNTGSTDVNAPKDGLDPKAAFAVSQRLNTKSTGDEAKPKKAGEPKDKAGKEDKPTTMEDPRDADEAARGVLEGIIGKMKPEDEDDKKGAQENGQGSNPLGGSSPTAEKGDGKKTKEKPEDEPITKDSALQYVHKNYDIFDTGAGIGDRDNKFSIKDLNKLKDSNVKEIADNAKKLIDEDVIGEYGGKDGKISIEDLENNALSEFEVEDGVILKTKDMTDEQIQKTKKDIQFLNQDEDGSKLIKAATEDGPVTVGYDPSYADGLGGTYSGNEIKLAKSALDDKKGGIGTLTHEFVHAATDNPDHDHAGDSKSEESIASVLGDRVKGRFSGEKVDEQETYDWWMDWTHEAGSYKGLDFDNEIIEDLDDIGIKFDLDFRTE